MIPLAPWSTFFGAIAGASATLIGFVFVAVSINLAQVVDQPSVSGRAREAVLVLTTGLVLALLGLVPVFDLPTYGALVLGIGAAMAALTALAQARALGRRHFRHPIHIAARIVGSQASLLPLVVGGALLATGSPQGLYWLVPGFVVTIAVAIFNTWILLVEILR